MPKLTDKLDPNFILDETRQYFALTAKDNPQNWIEGESDDSKDPAAFQRQVRIRRRDNENDTNRETNR